MRANTALKNELQIAFEMDKLLNRPAAHVLKVKRERKALTEPYS